ncbi:MAG: 2-C-methyl-D-erythritol 4-phosphate cytidylyltransferase [Coriobacteriia bacterium]|nr:2-C-methyl-D-erythritol 4-phosphate cytidylyltransferase [Coriobacteriia bacterium]
MSPHGATAIVCAGGTGQRLGLAGGKQLTLVAGRPVLAWTMAALDAAPSVGHIVLVCPGDRFAEYRAAAVEGVIVGTPVTFAASGDTRQESVASGIAAASDDATVLIVQDGARPLLTPSLVEATVSALQADPRADGAVAGHPSIDTLKTVTGGVVDGTPDRARYWAVQTPQAFRAESLRAAYARAAKDGFIGTDDAAIVEHAGGRVVLVEGPRDNIKVTVAEDIAVVEAVLSFRRSEEG